MQRALAGIAAGFIFTIAVVSAHAQDAAPRLLGVWKFVALQSEDIETGKKTDVYGLNPTGYLIYLPNGRMFALGTPSNRKAGTTDEERSTLYRTMFAYSGTYKLEGDQISHFVDVSADPAAVGTTLVRKFSLDGEQLSIVTAPFQSRVSGRPTVTTLVWNKD
jgi:hypothetical protein